MEGRKMKNKKIMFRIIVGLMILVIVGCFVGENILANDTKKINKSIQQRQQVKREQLEIIQKSWPYEYAQQASDGFFKAYHTFGNQKEYNQRAEIAEAFATKKVLTDKSLFTSDISYGDSYIDTSGLQSKAEKITYYPSGHEGNYQLGDVSVAVVSRFGTDKPGVMIMWYHVKFDPKANKLTDVAFIGKEDVSIDSNVVRNNQQDE